MAKSCGRHVAFIDGLGAGDAISSAKLILGRSSQKITRDRMMIITVLISNFIYKYVREFLYYFLNFQGSYTVTPVEFLKTRHVKIYKLSLLSSEVGASIDRNHKTRFNFNGIYFFLLKFLPLYVNLAKSGKTAS